MKKYFKLKIIFGTGAVIVLTGILGFLFLFQKDTSQVPPSTQPEDKPQETPKPEEAIKAISEPITNSESRITKKPFGIYITPQSSPVQPEKFSGYHTGTDFETTSDEVNQDIPIYAICTGKIRNKEIVSGYGGVIVQDCVVDGQTVTVLYGHLNIRQAQVLGVGADVKRGERLGSLAPANSEMSGGERKHLHLGIHKGSTINFKGYVNTQPELSGWLDAQTYL
jgi:hypothetical protein